MGNGQGSMGESRGYLVLRLYIHMEGRRCIVVVVVVALSSSSSSLSLSLTHTRRLATRSFLSFSSSFVSWLERALSGSGSFLTLAVGRLDRNIGRFGLFLPVYTYSYSRSTWPRKGRARLKPVKWN